MEVAYFKKHQKEDIYHYYEVHGGPGRNKQGFQVVVNFLNPAFPIIYTQHNVYNGELHHDGTWRTYQEAIPILKDEYKLAFEKAANHPQVVFK